MEQAGREDRSEWFPERRKMAALRLGIAAGRSVDRGLRILFLLRKAPQAGINYTSGILATYPGHVKDDIR